MLYDEIDTPNDNNLVKDICAFANTRGGCIIGGVHESGDDDYPIPIDGIPPNTKQARTPVWAVMRCFAGGSAGARYPEMPCPVSGFLGRRIDILIPRLFPCSLCLEGMEPCDEGLGVFVVHQTPPEIRILHLDHCIFCLHCLYDLCCLIQLFFIFSDGPASLSRNILISRFDNGRCSATCNLDQDGCRKPTEARA